MTTFLSLMTVYFAAGWLKWKHTLRTTPPQNGRWWSPSEYSNNYNNGVYIPLPLENESVKAGKRYSRGIYTLEDSE